MPSSTKEDVPCVENWDIRKTDCWECKSNKSKRPVEWKNKSNVRCVNCNETGHFPRNCPKEKKEQGMATNNEELESKNEEVKNSFTAPFDGKGEVVSSYWLGNSGATKHMRNSLEGMTDLRSEDTVIYFGNGNELKSNRVGTFQGTVEQSNRIKVNIVLHGIAYVPPI
jgi:hypothetical protein